MKCVCPHCGKKQDGSYLTFDFSEQFLKNKDQYFEYCTEDEKDEFYTTFTSWVNYCHNNGVGQVFFSEETLLKWLECDENVSGDWTTIKGRLRIPLDVWRKSLAAPTGDGKPLPGEYIKLFAFMCGDHFADTMTAVLDLQVQYYKEGDGAVKIASVRDRDGNLIANERHCPHCGSVMSYWAGRYPELVMTVLGGPRISKSTALAACADVFLNSQALVNLAWESYGIRVEDGPMVQELGDKSWVQFERECLQRYRNNQKVEPTLPGDREAIPRFSVKVRVGKNTNLVLTVVDLPGEYNDNGNQMGVSDAIYREYQDLYENVDCVWYCTDEAEIRQDALRTQETRARFGYDPGRQTTATPTLVNRMRTYAGLLRKNIPVVFLVGKSDTFTDVPPHIRPILYQPNYQAFTPASTGSWLELENRRAILLGQGFYTRAFQLRTYLHGINPTLIEAFEVNFPVHTFIATSNYGHGFEDSGKNCPFLRFQTEVPFLWMLAILGYLPVAESDAEYFAVTHGRVAADPLTHENLGMYGQGKNGYRAHHERKKSFSLSGLFGRRD